MSEMSPFCKVACIKILEYAVSSRHLYLYLAFIVCAVKAMGKGTDLVIFIPGTLLPPTSESYWYGNRDGSAQNFH